MIGAAVTLSMLAVGCDRSGDGGPINLTVANLERPIVTVEPWDGAEPRALPCGESVTFSSRDYHDGPWHVTVIDETSGEKLFDREVEGPEIYIAIRTGGAVVGDQPISGPAPAATCPAASETNSS